MFVLSFYLSPFKRRTQNGERRRERMYNTINNVDALYSVAWDRALAQRIPRVSLTRAARSQKSLLSRSGRRRRRGETGDQRPPVGMRGIRPVMRVRGAHAVSPSPSRRRALALAASCTLRLSSSSSSSSSTSSASSLPQQYAVFVHL